MAQDAIVALKTNSTGLQTMKRKMAKISRAHHDKIQFQGFSANRSRYKRCTKKALKCINKKIKETQACAMRKPLEKAEVMKL